MLCRACREDLDRSQFDPEQYRIARLQAIVLCCIECSRLNKEGQKERTREFLSTPEGQHVPRARIKPKPQQLKKKRKEKKTKSSAEDKAWNKLSPMQKREQMLKRRTPTEIRLHGALMHIAAKIEPQHPAGPYFIDLAIPSYSLAIEVDGDYHFTDEQRKKDNQREKHLRGRGWTVLRFTNEAIARNINDAIKRIEAVLARPPVPLRPVKNRNNQRALVPPPVSGWVAVAQDTSFNPSDWLDAIARDKG